MYSCLLGSPSIHTCLCSTLTKVLTFTMLHTSVFHSLLPTWRMLYFLFPFFMQLMPISILICNLTHLFQISQFKCVSWNNLFQRFLWESFLAAASFPLFILLLFIHLFYSYRNPHTWLSSLLFFSLLLDSFDTLRRWVLSICHLPIHACYFSHQEMEFMSPPLE